MNASKVTVLGVGNLLLQDEGIGVHVVHKLTERKMDYPNLEIIDAGTSPEIMASLQGDIDKLIIVDAVKGGDKPGTLYRFGLDDVDVDSSSSISLHEMGVLQNIKMMALLNRQPGSTIIIGVEPKTIDYGLELSPEISAKVPRVIELVLEEIKGAFQGRNIDNAGT